MKKLTFVLMLIFICSVAKSQVNTDSLNIRMKILELKIENTGIYLKRFHKERKEGMIIGTVGILAGIAPIAEGASADGNKNFMYLGITLSSAGALFMIAKYLRADRWLKKSGIELSGNGVQFVF